MQIDPRQSRNYHIYTLLFYLAVPATSVGLLVSGSKTCWLYLILCVQLLVTALAFWPVVRIPSYTRKCD